MRTAGSLQETHFKTAKLAAITTLIGAIAITATTPFISESARDRLFQVPFIYGFTLIPILGVLLIIALWKSLQKRKEVAPFVWTVLLFVLTFIGLGLLVFPYVIPPSITIYEAAASPSALVFMIVFIGFLIPIMLFYNIYNYVVFRGKVEVEHSEVTGLPQDA